MRTVKTGPVGPKSGGVHFRRYTYDNKHQQHQSMPVSEDGWTPWALDGFRGLMAIYRLGELCWGSLARIDKGHFSIPNPLIQLRWK